MALMRCGVVLLLDLSSRDKTRQSSHLCSLKLNFSWVVGRVGVEFPRSALGIQIRNRGRSYVRLKSSTFGCNSNSQSTEETNTLTKTNAYWQYVLQYCERKRETVQYKEGGTTN
jgi:hypothetical protein